MRDIEELTIDWNRSIHVDDVIDEKLVVSLTPSILKLRQESNKPITVGINSPGGSLDSLDTLLGLLIGPNQNGETGKIITVVTDQAYSAAANLLAYGDYSVAMKHAKILFHDVRYGEVPDVTPKKALIVSKSLTETNDAFSLRLANRVIRRLVWIYIDLYDKFDDCAKKYNKFYGRYKDVIGNHLALDPATIKPDLAKFATCLFGKVSSSNDMLIVSPMERLLRWIVLTSLAKETPSFKQKGKRTAGLLDGLYKLHKDLDGNKDDFSLIEGDLKLLLTLLIGETLQEHSENLDFSSMLDSATRDFSLMKSMSDARHKKSAIRLMLNYKSMFFTKEVIAEIEANEDVKKARVAEAMPLAHLVWQFCALMCRELFDGEHAVSPHDAQLLGLIDEVAGGGVVESRREYRIRMNKEDSEKTPIDSSHL